MYLYVTAATGRRPNCSEQLNNNNNSFDQTFDARHTFTVLVPSTHATCFGRPGHLLALNKICLKRKIICMYILNLWGSRIQNIINVFNVFNAWRRHVGPKLVACVDSTNKLCCGWQQYVYWFLIWWISHNNKNIHISNCFCTHLQLCVPHFLLSSDIWTKILQ